MTSDQLAIVNNIDHFIIFGSDEVVHITSPVDYADHVAVICSVIGDIELFHDYPRVWEALFGLIEFEGRDAQQFLNELNRMQAQLNAESRFLRAHTTSAWLGIMHDAAKHERDHFGYIASTRIDKMPKASKVAHKDAVFA